AVPPGAEGLSPDLPDLLCRDSTGAAGADRSHRYGAPRAARRRIASAAPPPPRQDRDGFPDRPAPVHSDIGALSQGLARERLIFVLPSACSRGFSTNRTPMVQNANG